MSDRPSYRSGYGNRRNDYRGRGGQNRSGRRKPSQGFYLPSNTIIYVLDILPYGYIDRTTQRSHSSKPIIQAIETPDFNLFEMEYDKTSDIQVQDKVIISKSPASKVKKVLKRLNYHKLTQTSKELLQSTIELHLEDQEEIYINFLNKCGPITKKRHTLNLLPGIGEKVMWEIIKSRDQVEFNSFEDFNSRVSVNDIKGLIAKRILNEIIDDDSKHYLFVKRKRMQQQGSQQQRGQQGSRSRSDGRSGGRSGGYRPRDSGGYSRRY